MRIPVLFAHQSMQPSELDRACRVANNLHIWFSTVHTSLLEDRRDPPSVGVGNVDPKEFLSTRVWTIKPGNRLWWHLTSDIIESALDW